VNRTHCAEVLSLVPTATAKPESGHPADVGTGEALPRVKVLLIDARVDGFFLKRLSDRGEPVGTTQHDTMDEAMWQAYSEYVVSDWRSCPDDVDPLQYIRARPDL
jgi:hypothetical protein